MAYLGDNGLSKLWVRMKSYINNRIETLEQGVQIELLWENASPTTAFAAQTISLDLNDYDEIRIDYRPFYDKTNLKSETCKIGGSAILDLVMSNMGYVNASTVFVGFRGLSATTTSVTFNGGYNYSATDDRCCIPLAIYGIKGVQ